MVCMYTLRLDVLFRHFVGGKERKREMGGEERKEGGEEWKRLFDVAD